MHQIWSHKFIESKLLYFTKKFGSNYPFLHSEEDFVAFWSIIAFFGTKFCAFSCLFDVVAKSEIYQLFDKIIKNINESRYIGIFLIIGKGDFKSIIVIVIEYQGNYLQIIDIEKMTYCWPLLIAPRCYIDLLFSYLLTLTVCDYQDFFFLGKRVILNISVSIFVTFGSLTPTTTSSSWS